MICQSCQKAVPDGTAVCPYCQAQLNASHPFSSPTQVPQANFAKQPANNPNQGDATGGVIPYKNPKALIAYYLGIGSGLPMIGLPIGIAAFILGVLGLRDRKQNPVIKGSVHAWIGIGCGGLFTLLWGGLLLALILGVAFG